MTRQLKRLRGSCHCRNIRFDLFWPSFATQIPARICGCSFCRKHTGTWTSNPDARLAVEIADIESVSKYRFGTETAEFYVCTLCGVVPFVVSEIDGNDYAVANVAALESPGEFTLSRSATDFAGEDVGSRLERRKRNWIREVKISASKPPTR